MPHPPSVLAPQPSSSLPSSLPPSLPQFMMTFISMQVSIGAYQVFVALVAVFSLLIACSFNATARMLR